MAIDLPGTEAIYLWLKDLYEDTDWTFIEEHSEDGALDVRLNVQPDWWVMLSGDTQYDTDYRGYWGHACINCDTTPAMLLEIAADLIEQVAEDIALSGGDS